MKKLKVIALTAGLLLLLAGCDMNRAPDGPLEEWAARKAAGAVNAFAEEFGDDILNGLDALENMGRPGAPFENNLESAKAYLLGQLEEKYGIEFVVVGDESLVNYGPLAGATYTCGAAPADAPDRVITALVSQSMYRDVRDDYAVYFFKEEAEAPVLALCREKDYVLDQRIDLMMPETEKTWTPEDGAERFLSESGAYVRVVLRLEDGREVREYAEWILDFLQSVGELKCDLLVQARADKAYIYHREVHVLNGFDAGEYTLEDIAEDVETFMSMGSPQ